MNTAAENANALNLLTLAQIDSALRMAMEAGTAQMHAKPESAYQWFPCGFSNLYIKLRKNDKRAKLLQDNHFRWDDYRKSYYLSSNIFTSSQSMDFKSDILAKVSESLTNSGIPNYVQSNMD